MFLHFRTRTFLQISLLITMLTLQSHALEIGGSLQLHPTSVPIDHGQLDAAGMYWLSTSISPLDFVENPGLIATDPRLEAIVQAGQEGYKIALGLTWDFKTRALRIPEPDTEAEQKLMVIAYRILAKVGPYVDTITLGNSPGAQTLEQDLALNTEGVIPLVRFVERTLIAGVDPYFSLHPAYSRPEIYIAAAFPSFLQEELQNHPDVVEMMRFIENDPKVTGLAMQLQVANVDEIEASLATARQFITEKPILIPEYSIAPIFGHHLDERIGDSEAGILFLTQYEHPLDWTLRQWLVWAGSNGISAQEFADGINTRSWYPPHFLLNCLDAFHTYGVRLACYPLWQATSGESMTRDPDGFLKNPLFLPAIPQASGTGDAMQPNPLVYHDAMLWIENHPTSGKKSEANYFRNILLDEGPDPYVYQHTNGDYYLMVTKGRYLELWRSRSFVDLEHAEHKIIFNPPFIGSNGKNLWAPEIHRIEGVWYVYYTATATSIPRGANEDDYRYVHVLRNHSEDPFDDTWEDLGKINTAAPGIDGHIFEWNQERYFAYSPYVGKQSGIAIARMVSPTEIQQPEVIIGLPFYEWEMTLPREILEGPQFLIGPGEEVFIAYSAGACWDDNYGLGYFRASKQSNLLDPASWERSPTQVFNFSERHSVYGPGHNCFTKSPDRTEDWIVYHAKSQSSTECAGRSTRAQRIGWDQAGRPMFGEPVPTWIYLSVPSGTETDTEITVDPMP